MFPANVVIPLNVACPFDSIVTPVPTLIVSENVVTTAMLTLSKFVWPSTSISWKVETPEWIAPDACAWIFTLPLVSLIAVASIPVKAAPLPTKLVLL